MTTTPGARSPSSASVYHKFTGRQGQFAMTFYLGSPGGKIANGPKLISPNARSCCGGSCGTDGGLEALLLIEVCYPTVVTLVSAWRLRRPRDPFRFPAIRF